MESSGNSRGNNCLRKLCRSNSKAVTELLDNLEAHNPLNPEEIVSVTFSVTRDLDALFPAAVARQRADWNNVPLLDVQQMHVEGDLEYCIRCLIHFNTLAPDVEIHHAYLRQAEVLRPDWSFANSTGSQKVGFRSF